MSGPEQGGTWGVLGGTFDPVHVGHLALASQVCQAKNLTGALFVPAYRHPFKRARSHASYDDRVAMLRRGIQGQSNFQISEIEAEQQLSGYTVDTIRALKRAFPEALFYFMVGADNIDQIEQWRNPSELLAETVILAGARPGYKPRRGGRFAADRIEFVPTDTADISSTALREMIGRGESRDKLCQWIPEEVLDYVEVKRLYR